MAVDQKEKKDLSKEETVAVLKEQGPVEGYTKVPVIDIDDKEMDQAEETDEKKTEPAKVEQKPKEEQPVKKADESQDPFLKIETELSKPDGKEDLNSFNEREKAYFHQMKRDRKARQRAEEERDSALFRETQRKREEAAKVEKPVEEDPIDILKKRDQTDFLTVADVLKILEKQNKKEAPAKETPKELSIDPVQRRYLELCDKEARSEHSEDYDAVMELTTEILNTNTKYLDEVARSINRGENPAIKSYELIKGDPEFSKLFPVAKTKVEARAAANKKPEEVKPVVKTPEEIRKEDDARKAQEQLERNQTKTKTTGHVGTGDDKPSDELTMEDLSKMSYREFANQPKKLREKWLRMYG